MRMQKINEKCPPIPPATQASRGGHIEYGELIYDK